MKRASAECSWRFFFSFRLVAACRLTGGVSFVPRCGRQVCPVKIVAERKASAADADFLMVEEDEQYKKLKLDKVRGPRRAAGWMMCRQCGVTDGWQ